MSKEVKHLQHRIEQLEAQLGEAIKRGTEQLAQMALYRKTIESGRDGVAVFDKNLCLQFCNQNYKNLFKQSAHLLTPGQSLDKIARHIAISGLIPDATREIETWVKSRTDIRLRQFDEPRFLELADGTWIRACDYHTDDGGILAVRTDVTTMKRREAELQATSDETRNILEAFFENSPVPMYIKDRDERYRAVNNAFVEVHGVPAEDILGKRIEDVLPDTAMELGRTSDRTILDGSGPISREHKIYRADGGERTVTTSKFPIKDRVGNVAAVGAISIDIARFIDMQENLASKSGLLETTLRSIDQGFAVFDKNLRILACNQRFYELHNYPDHLPTEGLTLREMMGHFAASGRFGTKNPQQAMERRFDLLTGPNRPDREERKQSDGTILDVRRTTLPDGGYVATFTDITDLKHAEQKAESAHQLLREILNTLNFSVCLYDADRRMVYCNEATEKMFAPQSALHRPGINFQTQLRGALDKKMMRGIEGSEDDWMRQKLDEFDRAAANVITEWTGGKWIVSDFRSMSDGGIVVVHRNITNRKRAEIALQESEENFRSLVENTEIGISIGVRRNLLFVNDAFARIFGYKSRGEVLQLGAYDAVIAPHDLERVRAISDARSDGRPAPTVYEFEGIRKDGSTFWLQRTSSVVNWLGARATLGTVIDVTQRHEAENKLRAALNAAETANRAKSDFLAKMSHELRTPLNAIIGFSEVLERETFGSLGHPRYKSYVGDIAFSGRHLLELINDILDMSKIEAGGYEIAQVDTDIPPIVAEAVQVIRGQMEQRRIDFSVSIDPKISTLYADRRAVRQMLVNLLSNAVKFTPEEGKIELKAGLLPDGGIFLSISDTGIGITKDDLDAVLQPFNQGSNGNNTVQPGTGLGLPIVRSLAEMHGGRLAITSEPGHGTTVTIELPNCPKAAPKRAQTV